MAKSKQPKIKIDPITKESLDGLKTDDDWTYSLVIGRLIVEHDERFIRERQIRDEYKMKINYKYVERGIYDKLYNDHTVGMEKIKELEDKLEDLDNKEKEFAVELKKQQENHDKLQDVLAVREAELKSAYKENKDLKEELGKLKAKQDVDLSGIQEQYDSLRSRYNNLRDYVNQGCISVDTIKTLHRIAWFLHRHKHSFFTIDQLTDKMAYNTRGEIAEALILSKYKVFPVRRYLIKDVECYGFDRQYLK